MSRIKLCLLSMALGACCVTPPAKPPAGPDPLEVIVGDEMCSSLHFLAYDGLTSHQEDIFNNAFAIWSKSTGTRLCREYGPGSGVREIVVRMYDSPGMQPDRLVCGQYWKQYDMIALFRSCSLIGDGWFLLVAMHELAHAFGLQHVTDDDIVSVMHPFANREALEGGLVPRTDRIEWCRVTNCTSKK